MATTFDYLSSLQAVREQANLVFDAAKSQSLTNFDLHLGQLEPTADFVSSVILDSFSIGDLLAIPPHGRWQHFEVGGVPRIADLLKRWRQQGMNDEECCRGLIDLFTVSVLLDAGAGNDWKYVEEGTNLVFQRSEGLAVASLHMFLNGDFASQHGVAGVDGEGLRNLSVETLKCGMQVNDTNPMTGVEGRVELLRKLVDSLLANSEIFGDAGRPGKLVDYLLSNSKSSGLDVSTLWSVLQRLLLPIWPQDRLSVDGKALGDAWFLSTLETTKPQTNGSTNTNSSNIQPFHKLTQWLAYSLMVPFERLLHSQWENSHLLTGLPEYRNGGLFVDKDVLTLKPEVMKRGCAASGQTLPLFDPGDDVVVEWRAMTIVLLDEMLRLVNQKLIEKGAKEPISLAQMLEAGTWKAGRVLAAKFRPETKSSPILIRSDGTVF